MWLVIVVHHKVSGSYISRTYWHRCSCGHQRVERSCQRCLRRWCRRRQPRWRCSGTIGDWYINSFCLKSPPTSLSEHEMHVQNAWPLRKKFCILYLSLRSYAFYGRPFCADDWFSAWTLTHAVAGRGGGGGGGERVSIINRHQSKMLKRTRTPRP